MIAQRSSTDNLILYAGMVRRPLVITLKISPSANCTTRSSVRFAGCQVGTCVGHDALPHAGLIVARRAVRVEFRLPLFSSSRVTGTGFLPTYMSPSMPVLYGVSSIICPRATVPSGGRRLSRAVGERCSVSHLRLELRLVLHVVPHLERRIALDAGTSGQNSTPASRGSSAAAEPRSISRECRLHPSTTSTIVGADAAQMLRGRLRVELRIVGFDHQQEPVVGGAMRLRIIRTKDDTAAADRSAPTCR